MTASVDPRVRRLQAVLASSRAAYALLRLGLNRLDIAIDRLRSDPATPG